MKAKENVAGQTSRSLLSLPLPPPQTCNEHATKHAVTALEFAMPTGSPVLSHRHQCRTQCALQQISSIPSSLGQGGRKGIGGKGPGSAIQACTLSYPPSQVRFADTDLLKLTPVIRRCRSKQTPSHRCGFSRTRGHMPPYLEATCKIPLWDISQAPLAPLHQCGGISIGLGCQSPFSNTQYSFK